MRLPLLTLAILTLAGCTNSGEIKEIQGQVCLDGEPLSRVCVNLQSDHSGIAIVSHPTDAEGNFRIQAEENSRWRPGTYQVWFTDVPDPRLMLRGGKPTSKVPEKYRQGGSATVELHEGTNAVPSFELSR